MFDIGLQELVLIFVIALLVFGPKNLPQLGRSMGRAMREFRRASDEFRSTIETNLQMNDLDPPPTTTTTAATETAAAPSALAHAEALPDTVLDPLAPAACVGASAPPAAPHAPPRDRDRCRPQRTRPRRGAARYRARPARPGGWRCRRRAPAGRALPRPAGGGALPGPRW